MIESLAHAKEEFEAAGLYVGGTLTLLVSEAPPEGDEIQVFRRASVIFHEARGWRAALPTGDPRMFEVFAPLDELVSLVMRVHEVRRSHGATYAEAFRETVEDADAYLFGDGVPRVKPPALRLSSPITH